MRYGIKFPTNEIGTDSGVIREWIVRAGALGFDHVVVIDHVLGVNPDDHPDYGRQFPVEGQRPPYKVQDVFHEPVVMLAYVNALAPHLELATGVIITPQRQTALLAKQLAQLDVMSGGKVRLCAGIGWNPVEYEALQVDFTTRGRRMDAQVAALRALWSEFTVHQVNEFENISGAGLSPRPVQQPIPVWLGGWKPRAVERVGRIADGWYYGHDRPPHFDHDWAIIRAAAEKAGRDPDAIGLEGAVEMRDGLAGMDARAAVWEGLGASHVVIDPMLGRYRGADHLEALTEIAHQFPLSNHP